MTGENENRYDPQGAQSQGAQPQGAQPQGAQPQMAQPQMAVQQQRSWLIPGAILVGFSLIALAIFLGLSQTETTQPTAETQPQDQVAMTAEPVTVNITNVMPGATEDCTAKVLEEAKCSCCDHSIAKAYGYHGEWDPDHLHKEQGWVTPSYAFFKSDRDGERGKDYATWLKPGESIPERGIVYFFRCGDDPEIILAAEARYWTKIFDSDGKQIHP